MTATPTAAAEVEPRAVASGTSRDEMLRMEDATIRFGDQVGIQDVSLSVPRGTILGIIGPSGAGKTTTIRLLTGSLEPTKGRVRVLGEDPRRFHRRTRERIGYMPQQFTLYPDLTAGENVDFVASLFGLLWFRRRRRVKEVLQLVELWDARGRRASNLSGGMQRRLELASALVHEPELLFLDEPTAGIDPLLRARIWDELHRLKDAGRTLLVTTQYVNEAEECDQVALVAQGRLAALATPDELRRQATGGDVIEVETAGPFEGSSLLGLASVRTVTQVSPQSFRVVVDDAGVATPSVVDAIGDAGGDVVTAREYRLSFDEIFAELVGRNQRRLDAGEGPGPLDGRDADVDLPPGPPPEGAAPDIAGRELEGEPVTTEAIATGHDGTRMPGGEPTTAAETGDVTDRPSHDDPTPTDEPETAR
ncbi:MAG TPA: ABC transporter ATP-binding protein [Vitreimonas sp.]|nr:ABC transporter ATP-binding protein [Vitreimonas sp.]